MLYLYKQNYNNMLKLSPLGHVHTGNIFVEGGVYLLGGYENTLLGYRTRLYRLIEKSGCLESIDVIMFGGFTVTIAKIYNVSHFPTGHVIYEMSTGKELEGLVPNQNDINIVWDEGCREILEFIFKKRRNNTLMQHSIQKVHLSACYLDDSHMTHIFDFQIRGHEFFNNAQQVQLVLSCLVYCSC